MTHRPLLPYIPNFARQTVPIFGAMSAVKWSLEFARMRRPSSLLDASVGFLVGFAIGTFQGLALALFLAFLASRRKPLNSLSDATGRHSLRILHLRAAYNTLFDRSSDILRIVTDQPPVHADPHVGTLKGETQTNPLTFGTEITIRLQPLRRNVTRVQVLSRPLVPSMIFDLGRTKRETNRIINLLKERLPAAAESA